MKGAAGEVIAGGAPRWEPVEPRGKEPGPAPTPPAPVPQVPQPVPAQPVPGRPSPVQQAPVQQAPVQQAPVQQVPAQQVPAQQVPAQQVPAQQAPVQQVPAAPVASSKRAPRRSWLPILTLLLGLLLGAAAVSVLSLLGLMPWSSGGRMMRCGGGECPELQPGQAATLVVGGTGTLADRVRIEVPPGALIRPAAIVVGMEEHELELEEVRHRGSSAFEVLGATMVIEPHGERFAAPVTVSLPYDQDRVDEGLPVEMMAVLVERVDDGAARRWEVVRASSDDRGKGVLKVQVRHFSRLTPIIDHDGLGALDLLARVESWEHGQMPLEDCELTVDVARERGIVVDMEAFWESIGLGDSFGITRTVELGSYFFAEDGGEFPLISDDLWMNVPPLRTGAEVELYEMLKRHLLSDEPTKLDSTDILDMALEAVHRKEGRRNLPTALMTAHNVVRVLARPSTWHLDFIDDRGNRCPPSRRNCGVASRGPGYGHSEDDAMYPVFEDLMGFTGEESLAERLGAVTNKHGRSRVGQTYTMNLFDPEDGVFESLPGITDQLDNAGSHYYFWLGALSHLALGDRIVAFGVATETDAKEEGKTARPGQAKIQTDNVYRGVALARCMSLTNPNRGPRAGGTNAREPRPGPVNPVPRPEVMPPNPNIDCEAPAMTSQKCPWSPDGYAVKPCPPGECYDAGPRGALACKQIKVPANAKRNSWRNVECLPGFRSVKGPCRRLLVSCEPIPK